jgi:integrase
MPRRTNDGIKKRCTHKRKTWNDCACPWWFGFHHGGREYRYSLTKLAHARGEKAPVSKDDALGWRDRLRDEIRGGTFIDPDTLPPKPAESLTATPREVLSLRAFLVKYLERRDPPVPANDRGCLNRFAAFEIDGQALGASPLTAFTEDTIEAVFAALRKQGLAASTRNKYVQAVTAMFKWATRKGNLTRNPIAEAENIRRERHAKRARRLRPDVLDDEGKIQQDGEERRLLAVASPHLQGLVIGALETGMRRGELLALRWRDVDRPKREITVRAETTKTKTGRLLPVSARLAAVLDMAHTAIDARIRADMDRPIDEKRVAALIADSHVFGDDVGLPIASVKRARETAVLKAHGHTPEWTAGNKLATASRAALKLIDLHFHDLRHEAGSRLLEAGWPLHHVQHMLGHANVSQTSTYLNATTIGLHDSMRRFDGRIRTSFAHEDEALPATASTPAPTTDANVLVN